MATILLPIRLDGSLSEGMIEASRPDSAKEREMRIMDNEDEAKDDRKRISYRSP